MRLARGLKRLGIVFFGRIWHWPFWHHQLWHRRTWQSLAEMMMMMTMTITWRILYFGKLFWQLQCHFKDLISWSKGWGSSKKKISLCNTVHKFTNLCYWKLNDLVICCGTIRTVLKEKAKTDSQMNVYKIVAPNESWVMARNNEVEISMAEIIFDD
jgi:hypothetical protein